MTDIRVGVGHLLWADIVNSNNTANIPNINDDCMGRILSMPIWKIINMWRIGTVINLMRANKKMRKLVLTHLTSIRWNCEVPYTWFEKFANLKQLHGKVNYDRYYGDIPKARMINGNMVCSSVIKIYDTLKISMNADQLSSFLQHISIDTRSVLIMTIYAGSATIACGFELIRNTLHIKITDNGINHVNTLLESFNLNHVEKLSLVFNGINYRYSDINYSRLPNVTILRRVFSNGRPVWDTDMFPKVTYLSTVGSVIVPFEAIPKIETFEYTTMKYGIAPSVAYHRACAYPDLKWFILRDHSGITQTARRRFITDVALWNSAKQDPTYSNPVVIYHLNILCTHRNNTKPALHPQLLSEHLNSISDAISEAADSDVDFKLTIHISIDQWTIKEYQWENSISKLGHTLITIHVGKASIQSMDQLASYPVSNMYVIEQPSDMNL